jgi:hypothetical protein
VLSYTTLSVELTPDPSGSAGMVVSVEGAQIVSEPGKPKLPVIRVPVALPDCDSVTVECRVQKKTTRENQRLAVNREESQGSTGKPRYNTPTIADIDTDVAVQLDGITNVRKQRIGILTIYPIQYDSGRGRVTIRDEMEITLRPHGTVGAVNVDVGPFENILRGNLINRTSFRAPAGAARGASYVQKSSGGSGSVSWCSGAGWRAVADCAISNGTDYLIIQAEGLNDSLTHELAAHRAEFNGFNVSVARMPDIDGSPNDSTTADTIRAFIKRIYDSKSASHMSDSLLAYVLLLGDAAGPNGEVLLPPYYGYPPTTPKGRCASDAFYSFLSGEGPETDFFADVFLGRIPVDSISNAANPDPDWELRNVVTKILNYRPKTLAPKRSLMVGGGSDKDLPDFKDLFDGVDDMYSPLWIDGDSVRVDKMYRNDWPNNLGNDSYDVWFSDSVATRLETDDYWLLGLFDHGIAYYLMDSFFPMDYDTLRNADGLFLALIYGCDMGWFDVEIDNAYEFCCLDTTMGTPIGCYTPTADMDCYDVAAERLVIQPNGAIGAVASTRKPEATYKAGNTFASYYRSIFEQNAYTLGEILVSTVWYVSPDIPYREIERQMVLFGDPALNIVWENIGEAEQDSVDLALSATGIQFAGAVRNRYLGSGVSSCVNVRIRNEWKYDATDIVVTAWDGDPDSSGATLLGADTLLVVPAYGSVMTEIPTTGLDAGKHEIHVRIDTTAYAEPTYANNRAFAVLRVHDYQSGFPVDIGAEGSHSVTIQDVVPTSQGEEMIVSTSDGLKCYGGGGSLCWARGAAHYGSRSGFINGTPLVAPIYKTDKLYCLQLDSLLYVLDGTNGQPVDSIMIEDTDQIFEQNASYDNHTQMMAVSDLATDDSTLEIIVRERKIENIDTDGTYLKCYQFTDSGAVKSAEQRLGDSEGIDKFLLECEIAVGDLEGDGVPEIVARTTNGSFGDSLYVLDSNLRRKWQKKLGRSYAHWHDGLAIVPDGVVSGGARMAAMALGRDRFTTELYLFKFDADENQSQWSLGASREYPWFAPADYDGDGSAEIITCHDFVYAGARFGRIMKVDIGDGSMAPDTTSSEVYLQGTSIVSPLVVDTDLSPGLEIVAVFRKLNIPSTSLGGEYTINIMDMSFDTVKELSSFPYDAATDVRKYYGPASMPMALPAVSDIDSDGIVETAYVSWDSVLHVVEIGSVSGYGEWPQRYRKPGQSNNLRQVVTGEYDADMTVIEDIEVAGDAVFNGRVSLLPGVDVKISGEDVIGGGADTNKTEIHVRGALNATGGSGRPVRFIGWSPSGEVTETDHWWGIMVHDSSVAPSSFDHCVVRNAYRGIQTNDSITVTNSVIEQCDLLGISIAGVDSAGVYVGNTTIRDAELAGVNLLAGSTARLHNCTVEDMPGYGVEVYSGASLSAGGGSRFRDCDVGIYVHIGDSLAVSAVVESCFVEDNDIGIWAYNISDVLLQENVIDGNATTGVYCLENASITITDNEIENSAAGVFCYDGGSAWLENNKITGHGTGVKADGYADPDIGHQYPSAQESPGYNSIHTNTYNVANLMQGGGAPTVSAENNYWKGRPPDCFPRTGKIVGSVDYVPSLCSDPNPVSPFLVETTEALPAIYALGHNYPNPFNPVTALRFEVPPPGGTVSLVVYNVLGQRVKTLLKERQPPGYHIVVWDGTNDRGGNVATGVYFLRMEAPGFVKVRKMLLIK